MKAHELRDLSQIELEARLNDELELLEDLKFNKAVAGQLENPNRLKMTRREIARIRTIINENQSAE